MTDFTLPEDVPGMWESYAALIRGELDCVRTQKRYRRKDGGLVWTNLTASLIRDARGEPTYTLALVEDVSDRHLLEEQLRYQALHDPLTGLPTARSSSTASRRRSAILTGGSASAISTSTTSN